MRRPVLLTAMLLALPVGLVAQAHEASLDAHTSAGAPGRTVIAVPDAFPDVDAVSLLIRNPDRDVVVLHPEHVSVETLMMAISLLEDVRATRPAPTGGQMIPVTGFAITREPSEAYRRRMGAVLRRLRSAPVRMIGDLGPGRWVSFGAGGA